MKNKRSKYSVFYNSIKNKRRKQEKNHNLRSFNMKNFTNLEKSTDSPPPKQDYFDQRNKNHSRNHDALFLSDESPPLPKPNYSSNTEELLKR